MNAIDTKPLLRRVKICMWVMIIGLAISGITAFPIESELALLAKHDGIYPAFMQSWLHVI